jgi:hypothetical protein
MARYRIEQLLVMALGFLVGAILAICTAPGDMLLWAAAGIALSIFARAFFLRDLGGELLWPHARKTSPPKPNAAQR